MTICELNFYLCLAFYAIGFEVVKSSDSKESKSIMVGLKYILMFIKFMEKSYGNNTLSILNLTFKCGLPGSSSSTTLSSVTWTMQKKFSLSNLWGFILTKASIQGAKLFKSVVYMYVQLWLNYKFQPCMYLKHKKIKFFLSITGYVCKLFPFY